MTGQKKFGPSRWEIHSANPTLQSLDFCCILSARFRGGAHGVAVEANADHLVAFDVGHPVVDGATRRHCALVELDFGLDRARQQRPCQGLTLAVAATHEACP